MKIEYLEDNCFVLHIKKNYIKDLDLSDKQSIEAYFKKTFVKLKKAYHLDIAGYYNIGVYVNDLYGLIIEVNKLNSEYFKMYGSKVDMKITIESNNAFLYEVDDYFITDIFKDSIGNTYYKDDKYYIEVIKAIEEEKYNILLENSNIIYNDDVYDIISSCNKI